MRCGIRSSSASRRYITSYAGPPSTRSCGTGVGIVWVPSGAVTGTGRRPVSTVSAASRITQIPRPPASTTPASASTASCSGVRASASRAAWAASAKTSRARAPGVPACARAASAAARATVSMVPSTGTPTASYAASVARRIASAITWALRSSGPRRGDPVRDRAEHLAQDHPAVAAGAEQRAAGEGRERGREVDRGVARGRLAERVAGGRDGEEHVGAGVSVGHRVDVERVDLLAGGVEGVGGDVDEAADHRETDRAATGYLHGVRG